MIPGTTNIRKSLLAWAVILCAIFLVVSNPSRFYFANDDFLHIPMSGTGHFGQAGLMRIVSEFSLFVDYFFWGTNAFGYHLTNLLLHLLNTLLVFYTSRLMLKRYSKSEGASIIQRAFIISILFLVYPFHVEAVYWVIGRGALLGCFFALLTIFFYLEKQKPYRLLLSLLFFIVGLFAYEITYVIPVMIVVLFCLETNERSKQEIKQYVYIGLYWIVFLLYLAMKFFFTGVVLDSYTSINIVQFNFVTLFYNFFLLIGRSIILPLSSSVLLSVLFLVFIIGAIWMFVRIYKRNKSALKFLLSVSVLYVLALLPVVSLGIDSHDSESGRFLYLPAVFFILLLVEAINAAKLGLIIQRALLVGVTIYFAGCLVMISGQYQHSAAIAMRTLRALPAKKTYRNVYAIDLPTQYKGATIFRSEFDHAVNWIRPDLRFDSLIIISSKEIVEKNSFTQETGSIECLINSGTSFISEGGSVFQIQRKDQKVYKFIQGKDLLLFWTDSTLSVIP